MLELQATCAIEKLIQYAVENQLLDELDHEYARNLLLDMMQMDSPAESAELDRAEIYPTATPILNELCSIAVQKGIIEDLGYARELFSTRLISAVTPSPKEVRRQFAENYAISPEKATSDFYTMCQKTDYVKIDAIKQNIRYFADTPVGELEITINLSKPEKDPKEIAKLKNAPSVGYPRCMLCKENPGYAGRSNFPARQNHRIIPLNLNGQDWFLQYSPYAYYSEHCIVFNKNHVPMKVDRGSIERLFSFTEQFPHYLIGSNADLPIVGGSILNHDHFQGGQYSFPMEKATSLIRLTTPFEDVQASILNWPMTTISLCGKNKLAIIELSDQILKAWREWTDEACDIYANTEETPHNTITPILRKIGDGWRLNLVLRNNRTDDENPLGIFHPHNPLHHIKKENIGLIEVMGLFILPGRLKYEFAQLEDYLTGEKPLCMPLDTDPVYKHFAWVSDIVKKYGYCKNHEEAQDVLRKETALVCAQVLIDSGVYKLNDNGIAGILRFTGSLGMHRAD